MLSLRLKKIVSLLDSQDKVVDIGCDHGYLGIYAIREKLVKSIILTDIKESALSMARKNVKNSNLDIPLIVRDRKSTRLNSSHKHRYRMPSSA